MDPKNTSVSTAQSASDAASSEAQPSMPPVDQSQNPLAKPPTVQIGSSERQEQESLPPVQTGEPAVNGEDSAVLQQSHPDMSTASQQQVPAVPPKAKKNKSMIWAIILLVFSFFCGLFLAGWYFQTQFQKMSEPEEAVVPVVKQKEFVIGTDATFTPMEFVASGGAVMGYDIDLGTMIGQETDTKVTFKNITWDELFPALEKKEVDMIISSVTITDERKKQYDFSDNYLNAGQVIIVKRGDTTISKSGDLQGKKIAVQEGTTNEQQALALTSSDLVIRYPDFEQATQSLVEGKVDAMLSDLPGAKGIVTKNPSLQIASDPLTNEYYGVVFRKGDPNVKRINDAISVLKTKGVLTDLKQKWLE